MNKKSNQELKEILEELNKMLQGENLSQEERESLELHAAQVSGLLLSTWLPSGIIRKALMLSFILIGVAGFFSQNQWLLCSFLIAGMSSPRLVGEGAVLIGIFVSGYQSKGKDKSDSL